MRRATDYPFEDELVRARKMTLKVRRYAKKGEWDKAQRVLLQLHDIVAEARARALDEFFKWRTTLVPIVALVCTLHNGVQYCYGPERYQSTQEEHNGVQYWRDNKGHEATGEEHNGVWYWREKR